MNAIAKIEGNHLKTGLPQIEAGDTVRVHVKVKETSVSEEKGKKNKETERERVQVFEGIVIGIRGDGTRATVTVRKISFGTGVERIFPLHAKSVDRIEVVKRHRVRRAKLYYLRERKGRASRMKEKRTDMKEKRTDIKEKRNEA
jgi:large subunit ribosomal protein L19